MKKLFTLLALLFSLPALAQTHAVTWQPIAEDLKNPWSLVFLSPDKILVAEKRGSLRIITGKKVSKPIALPGVHVKGQGGLMDLTLHPQFNQNGWIYYSYAIKNARRYATALGRFRLLDEQIKDRQQLFVADNFARGGRHFGSRIVFDARGDLYLCLGDRGMRDEAQNPKNHIGAILRLHDDGRIPADNPFANSAVYSFGHRNLQGCVFDADGFWAHEHGPFGGDELNLIKAGANYGWPRITYGEEYTGGKIGEGTHAEGLEQPLAYWSPSIAPSGMLRYQGAQFPNWRGDIFLGALAGQHLRRVVLRDKKVIAQEVLLQGHARIREVAADAAGFIYVLTDARNGKLLRLAPAR